MGKTTASLMNITRAVNATVAALQNMKQADNPKAYQEKLDLLDKLKDSQAKFRQAIKLAA